LESDVQGAREVRLEELRTVAAQLETVLEPQESELEELLQDYKAARALVIQGY
jgi:hypothetical protein